MTQTKTNDKTVWTPVPEVPGAIYAIYELNSAEQEAEFRVKIPSGGYFWATRRVPRDIPRDMFLKEAGNALVRHRDGWIERQPK